MLEKFEGMGWGSLRIFTRKNFYRAKRVSLRLEIWEDTVSLPIRSRGGVPGKLGDYRKEATFPES